MSRPPPPPPPLLQADIGMVWSWDHQRRMFLVSLRGSERCTVDLSTIAKRWNGGVRARCADRLSPQPAQRACTGARPRCRVLLQGPQHRRALPARASARAAAEPHSGPAVAGRGRWRSQWGRRCPRGRHPASRQSSVLRLCTGLQLPVRAHRQGGAHTMFKEKPFSWNRKSPLMPSSPVARSQAQRIRKWPPDSRARCCRRCRLPDRRHPSASRPRKTQHHRH
jgi:hypothetical protein